MTRPLWVDPDEHHFAPLTGDMQVDVAVVGAGFSGLGAAWSLAETGADVAVLEARTVASGASGRNAGFVLAGPAAGAGAVHELGIEETAAIWAFTRRNHVLIAGIIEENDLACGYLRRGSMSLAASDEEFERLLADHALVAPLGVTAVRVEPADLPRPFDRLYRGGLYYPGNAEMNPGRFLRLLSGLLPESVRIFEGTAVKSIAQVEGGGWMVQTAGGRVRAARVVLATNAYTDALLATAPIAPTRGQVGATEPLERVIVPFPMYADHGYQYWRQTPEGRLVVGGWRNLDIPAEVGPEETLHLGIGEALERFTERVTGQAASFAYRWAGIMGFTPRLVPFVGPVPDHPGMSMAAGYSGHGVAMAFLCGYEAGRIAGGEAARVPASFTPAL